MPNNSSIPSAHFAGPDSFGLFFIPMSLLGSVGSLVALYLLAIKHVTSYASTDPLFLSLAGTSLWISLCVAPFNAYSTSVGYPNFLATPRFAPLCRFVAFSMLFIANASPLAHVSIAINRFIVVIFNGKHLVRTLKVTVALVLFPWLLSSLMVIWPVFGVGGEYAYSGTINRCVVVDTTHSIKYHVFIRTAGPLTCIAVMLVCYTAVFTKVIVARRTMRVHQERQKARLGEAAAAEKQKKDKSQRSMEMHVTKVAFLSCLTLVCTNLPSALVGLLSKSSTLHGRLASYISILPWLGFTMSPWLAICLDTTMKAFTVQHFKTRTSLNLSFKRSSQRKTPTDKDSRKQPAPVNSQQAARSSNTDATLKTDV